MKTFLVDGPRSGALRALNYAPAVERIRRAGSNSARPLRKIVREFGPAFGTVFTRLDCHSDHGVELLSQSDMFAADPKGRVIRRDSMRDPRKHYVDRGQVLIAGAGTLGDNELYGRAILADDRLAGKYVGPDSMTLVFENPDDDFSLFAYAWLASPTGLQAIRSTSYGTKLLRFRPDLLSSLPVPEASSAIISRVASLVRRCSSGREEYARQIRASREIVGHCAGIADAVAASKTRVRKSLVWTGPLPSLCAWNFAAGNGVVQSLRGKWRTRLRDVVTPGGIFLGPRAARVHCDPPHGVQLYSQRDVFMIRSIGQRVARTGLSDRLLFVPEDALLVAANGQMNEGSLFGKIELATFLGEGAGITGHIMRVLPLGGQRDAIFGLFDTTLGQWLLKSTAVGTSVPSMRIDLLEDLPFPDPDCLPTERISHHIQAAERARVDADAAEIEAIRVVEQEVLPQWLA